MPVWLAILSGTVAAIAASSRRKNPVLWFVIGGILPLLLAPSMLLFTLFAGLALRAKRGNTKTKKEEVVTLDIPPEVTLSSAKEHREKLWYFIDEKRATIGPMSFFVLEQKWKEGTIGRTTLIWNESLSKWKTVEELFPNV